MHKNIKTEIIEIVIKVVGLYTVRQKTIEGRKLLENLTRLLLNMKDANIENQHYPLFLN